MKDKIKFGKLKEDAKVPSFGRDGDGCMDVYACFEQNYITIQPNTVKLIPTGICSTFDSKYRISIRERGSNTKGTLIVMAGQIDSNYTGEWFVALYNGSNFPVHICKEGKETLKSGLIIPYEKAIAQCAVEFIPQVEVVEVPAIEITSLNTNRGAGKLGSSGK